MSDPTHYKIMAAVQFVIWVAFFIRYSRALYAKKYVGAFSTALLVLAIALTVYSAATLARQWFGPEYQYRQLVRTLASLGVIATGAMFHLALSKARKK